VHPVNQGASREAAITGLPLGLTRLRVFVTDARHGMEDAGFVPFEGGRDRYALGTSFTSLLGKP
jgi:hypothetical protein